MSNGNHVIIHNNTDKTSGQLSSTLLFDPVNRRDHGMYTCRAFNHPDCYSDSKIELIVQCMVESYAYSSFVAS